MPDAPGTDRLFDAAHAARANAYAPYSGFAVGAAILMADGQIFAGCNMENVAYPQGICAEAGALAAMVAAGGSRDLRAVLVLADGPMLITPCGGCRQKLAEFGARDVPVYLAAPGGIRAEHSLGALLPGAFDPGHLQAQE